VPNRLSAFRTRAVRLHRWVGLTLGVVAVLFTTAGALLLFRPDAQRALNEPAFAITRLPGDRPVSVVEALRTVERAHPELRVSRVWFDGQVYRVFNAARSHWWSVDPGSGRVLGHDGTSLDGFWGVLHNLHTCMLTCTESPGYQGWLTAVIPGTGLELSQAVYALVALTLIGMAVTGLWLGSATLRRGLRVRWSRAGRFGRDSDLHRLVGLVAGPFLIVWAITGSGFQLPWVEHLWYTLTPGAAPAAATVSPAAADHGPDIGLEAAFQDAATLVGPRPQPIMAQLPTGATTRYRFRFEAAPETYGDVTDGFRVSVDRYTGRATFEDNPPGSPAATVLWEDWRFPVHSGIVAHGWWRLPWLVFGLMPLALLVTGVSAWLVRRRVARQRRLARRERATTRAAEVVADSGPKAGSKAAAEVGSEAGSKAAAERAPRAS
jgi:uncharacterized iron-regulated membrane protein